MSSPYSFHSLAGRSVGFWVLFLFFCALTGMGALSALYMEHNGHWVTGMSNQIGWGLPHVFAVFLIVASTGALNVASLGSVFSKNEYKPIGRISALCAMAVQAGGLAVLILDLGHSDRLIIAITSLQPKSIFSLNIFLYSGFFALVLSYLWLMMDKRMERFYLPVAFSAFIWRLMVTTGTGSIFGLVVARAAYHSAVMAPMFIAMSMSFGLGIFLIVLLALEAGAGRPAPSDELRNRLRVLMAVFIATTLYFVVMMHITNLYSAERRDVSTFLLFTGGIFPMMFWGGFVVLGSVLPLIMFLNRPFGTSKVGMALGSALTCIGGIALMYVIIVGGQAFPLEIFPGKIVSSSFYDGAINSYMPSLPELLLGLMGFGVVGLILMVGLWALAMLPGQEEEEPTAVSAPAPEMFKAH